MSDPNNKNTQDPTNAPKDVVTNSDDTNNITNTDGVSADPEGSTDTLSESEPSTALNADNSITNDTGTGEILSEDDIN